MPVPGQNLIRLEIHWFIGRYPSRGGIPFAWKKPPNYQPDELEVGTGLIDLSGQMALS